MLVYPTSKNALNIRHPVGGQLRAGGSDWPNDGFTARMLTDRAVTSDKAAAYVAESAKEEAAKPDPIPVASQPQSGLPDKPSK